MDIIGSIDEQIESCKKMITTLEELLSLNFKHKFGNIFDNSKPMTTLETYLDYIDGFSFKPEKYDANGKYKIITIKNVKNLEIDDNFENKTNDIHYLPKNIFVNIGDILLSMTGNAGRVAINHLNNVLLNQRVAKIFCKTNNSNIFIYCLMKEKNMENYIMSISSGTSQKNLSMLDLFKTKINIISDKKITLFQEENKMIWNNIINIKIKIKKLKEYKENILPLLLNEQVL